MEDGSNKSLKDYEVELGKMKKLNTRERLKGKLLFVNLKTHRESLVLVSGKFFSA